jgi:hypothetical protein
MTESQNAFEAWMDKNLPYSSEPLTMQAVWQAAEAYGRKKALEDVANGLIKQKSWTQDMAHAVVQHAADEGESK